MGSLGAGLCVRLAHAGLGGTPHSIGVAKTVQLTRKEAESNDK